MIKALVSTPFIPISRFPHSHRGSQGVIYADMIRQAGGREVTCNMSLDLYHEDFNQFDELWVYHGNDFDGHLNLFGGMQNFPYAHNFRNFSRFKGKVYSLAIPFPDYHGLLSHKMNLDRKAGRDMQQEWKDADMDNLLRMQREAVTVTHPHVTPRLVIGDSHSICLYRPGWTVQSIPFKTLHGALKIGIRNLLPPCYESWDQVSELDLYFGNIDVRHHLLRQEDPERAVEELVDAYTQQAEGLCEWGKRRVKIYELLPIEDERRRIPKTGYYEGAPFYGSREDRDRLRKRFRDLLETYAGSLEIVRWTVPLLNDKGELDMRKMERPKSVHLSRDAYPYWRGKEWTGDPTELTGEE